MVETRPHEALGLPALRLQRWSDGGISVDLDEAEWRIRAELADFVSWLAPVVRIFVEHDEIARAIGASREPLARAAEELEKIARLLLEAGTLQHNHGRWRFRAGPVPLDAPVPDWGHLTPRRRS